MLCNTAGKDEINENGTLFWFAHNHFSAACLSLSPLILPTTVHYPPRASKVNSMLLLLLLLLLLLSLLILLLCLRAAVVRPCSSPSRTLQGPRAAWG